MSQDTENLLITQSEARCLLGGVSHMFIYRRLKEDPSFPRPIQYALNGPKFFKKLELERWIDRHQVQAQSEAVS